MIDLLSTMQVVLREADFTTHSVSSDPLPTVCFEDDALVGFGCVFADPGELVARWKATETSLLARYSSSLRIAGEKAWNVCTVLLCAAPAEPVLSRQVRWIEEDLERTRKIAGCGIATREDLLRTLLPLLPLQYQPALFAEDLTGRLRQRVKFIAPRVADVALESTVPPAEVVRLLGEPT